MANVFRNALQKDIGTTYVDVYECPAGLKSIVIELDVCNKTNAFCTVTAAIEKAGADYEIIFNAPVPVGGTLSIISGQKVVLEAGDKIKVKSNSITSLNAICSVLEDV